MNIEIIKSKRKTISIEIKKDLRIIVRAPQSMSKKAINEFVEKNTDWINKNIERIKLRTAEEQKEKQPAFTELEIKEMTEQAKKALPEISQRYAKIMGVKYNRISVKHQVTRWGSCSAKGNLNFNCLLLLCPEEVQEYVVIHELCHLKQLNHSPKFWAEVAKFCPDYKACKKWLKINGNELIGRLK